MKFRKKAYRLRAVAGVWIASMLGLIIVMLGWAMDTSYVAYVAQQLQVAADAAALAGAAEAKTDLPLARLRAQATGAANSAGITAGVPDPVLLELNGTNLPNGDIVTGRYYRWDDFTTDPVHYAGDFVETSVLGEINAVKAVARRTETSLNGKLPLLFGPIFGVDTIDVTRDAIAMVGGTTGAGLIVLCSNCACALEFSGSTQLTLDTASGYDGDAAIQVNSDATGCNNFAAVCGDGSSLTIDAPEINIVAEGPESSCFNANAVVPPLNPGSPSIPDPLAGLPEPTIDYSADRGCIGNSACVFLCDAGPLEGSFCVTNSDCPQGGKCLGALVACEGGSNDGYACMGDADCPGGLCERVPQLCFEGANADMACIDVADCPGGLCLTTVRAHSGYYSGGFRMNSAKSNLILDGGVYSLDNADGGAPAGLVINGGHFIAHEVMLHIVGNGEVDLAGSGNVEISPISDETDIYWGVSIFQSRTNYNEARVIGTSDTILEGTYYFPNNHLELGGQGIAVGNQLIAYTLDIHGDGTYTLHYDGRFTSPGYKVWLVK